VVKQGFPTLVSVFAHTSINGFFVNLKKRVQVGFDACNIDAGKIWQAGSHPIQTVTYRGILL